MHSTPELPPWTNYEIPKNSVANCVLGTRTWRGFRSCGCDFCRARHSLAYRGDLCGHSHWGLIASMGITTARGGSLLAFGLHGSFVDDNRVSDGFGTDLGSFRKGGRARRHHNALPGGHRDPGHWLLPRHETTRGWGFGPVWARCELRGFRAVHGRNLAPGAGTI